MATGADNVAHILASIPDEKRRELKRQAFSAGLDNPALPMSVRRIDKLLGDMDRTLAESDWLAGGAYSLADAGMTPYVVRVEHLAMTMMLEDRPSVLAWLARVKARPSYDGAMSTWFNADYLKLSEAKGREAQALIASMLVAPGTA